MVVRSFSTGGGLELYAHKVIEGLLQRGLRITVVCEECDTDLTHNRLNVIKFSAAAKRTPKWRKLEHQFAQATEAVARSGPFDLVHTQHFPVAGADVVTFHNHSVAHLGKVGSAWENMLNKVKAAVVPAYLARDRYDRLLCKSARSFIFPSHVCRDDFCQAYRAFFPLERTPYVVACPGSDLSTDSQISPDNSGVELRSMACETHHDHTFTFLFVGRGFRRKGLDTVLTACSLLVARKCRFRLLIAGLREKPLDVLRLRLLGLTRNVEYLGFRSDMDVVYREASAFVMPSRHDVFGMAPLQAMRRGLVPIVSRCMGVSELLAHRHDALILENQIDAEQLSGLMQELIDNPNLLGDLRTNALQVAKDITWDGCVEATLQAYRLARSAD